MPPTDTDINPGQHNISEAHISRQAPECVALCPPWRTAESGAACEFRGFRRLPTPYTATPTLVVSRRRSRLKNRRSDVFKEKQNEQTSNPLEAGPAGGPFRPFKDALHPADRGAQPDKDAHGRGVLPPSTGGSSQGSRRAAQSIAKGVLAQLGEDLNSAHGVIFGDYFSVRAYLADTVDGMW